MAVFQPVPRQSSVYFFVIVLQFVTIYILYSRDTQAATPSTSLAVASPSTSKSAEISLVQLDRKYRTSKGLVHHYTRFYEHYLSKYRQTKFRLLEIGLGCGMSWGVGVSAALWREYFGPAADIHFLEFDRACGEKWMSTTGQKLNITMHYGSQEDQPFLQSLAQKYANAFDVIIDDGGHRMTQQINSLTILFPTALRSGGTYAIEDVYTSYLTHFGGGYQNPSTLVEFIKDLVDDVQSKSPTHKNSSLGPLIHSFEIGDKICLFTKK